MKRLWIGIGVLMALLILGATVSFFMAHSHKPISTNLALAAQAAVDGNLPKAIGYAEDAQAQWHRCRDFTAAFADHDVLEEMDALFAEIRIYAEAQDATAFAAVCAHLSELAKAVAESHHPKWQNLL